MRPNIFFLDLAPGTEDHLTACWHYVLSVVPGISQAFVDSVASRAGTAGSRFIGAIDHPSGDEDNHPDLLLRCDDYDVLFEHKLFSALGPNQVERYLTLSAQKNWKFALLAARPIEIPGAVASSPLWISPRTAPHFLWQDVHQLTSSFDHHIAQEFKDYLEVLGLVRFEWPGLGDPFVDDDAADALRELYKEIDPIFAAPGVSCRGRPKSLTYEVRRPFPPIHLINIYPIESVAQWDKRLWGPVMAVGAWVKREGDPSASLLPTGEGQVEGGEGRILFTGNTRVRPLPYDRSVFLEREYYLPLAEILRESRAVSAERLVSFVRRAVTHLRGEFSAVLGLER